MFVVMKKDLSIAEVEPSDVEEIAMDILDSRFFVSESDAAEYANRAREFVLCRQARQLSARAKVAAERADFAARHPEKAREARLSTLKARGLDNGIIDLSKPVY